MTLTKLKFWADIRDYIGIGVGMISYSIGWNVFLLPNSITTGGVPGISSVLFWGTGFPVQWSYFIVNAALLLAALKILGFKFCVKTIYGVFVLTFITSLFQKYATGTAMLHDQPFMAAIIGAIFTGSGIGLGFASNGSTGGTDIVAAIVNKYRDISLGRVVMLCDIIIITSSYLVFRDWEKVIYGYIVLFVMSYLVDYVVNGARSSVQFFIVSQKWEEIGQAINNDVDRGCTVIDAHGFYTGQPVGMLFVIARRAESRGIFQVVNDIDPKAFVSQSAVSGVYGMGFDRIKVSRKKIKND